MLLILTGTISPAGDTEFLKLRDKQERLWQYEESISFFINTKAFSKIIFCENSGYGEENLCFLVENAKRQGIALEILSFLGNNEKTRIHGKGYGEGEILKYIFENSRLLTDETAFMKITGRLKVDNITKLVSGLQTGQCYFNIPNRTHREMYDTKIYVMPTEMFRRLFLDVYNRVMDREGMFLEKVYTTVLLENEISVKNFPYFPRVTGVSASTGADYVYTEWKCRIKDILSRFQFYKVKK